MGGEAGARIGLMGVIFNGVDSKEQALAAVRSCATRS